LTKLWSDERILATLKQSICRSPSEVTRLYESLSCRAGLAGWSTPT